jgi:hypothetical protein
MLLAFLGQVANPRAARNIPRQAIAAGLTVDPDIGSSALVLTQEQLAEAKMQQLAADQAVLDGTITREQADTALAAIRAAAREGRAFSAVTVFGFVCRKG